MSNKNIWYLPGPFHQYNEDVKALAKASGLRIIDANATETRNDEASETPEVTLREFGEPVQVLIAGSGSGDNAGLHEMIAKLNIERDLIVTLIESAEGVRQLEHPEAGELPIRLFQALTGIHSGIQSLRNERDGLAEDNESLRAQLESLKAADGADVQALKAQLDAANVTYRANASKEVLEKLVADQLKA